MIIQIIKDKRISGVVFTGSVEGGYKIQNATSNRLINTTLELGGKDAAYIARDADLKYSVESIVDGAMYNSGQSCCSIERVYVHKELYNDFIDMTNELILNKYIIGDPLYENPKDIQERKRKELIKQLEDNPDPELVKQLDEPQKELNYDSLEATPNMGPMAQKSSIEFLSKQVNDAIDKGATLVIGDNK